jgi:hypothetical protein
MQIDESPEAASLPHIHDQLILEKDVKTTHKE